MITIHGHGSGHVNSFETVCERQHVHVPPLLPAVISSTRCKISHILRQSAALCGKKSPSFLEAPFERLLLRTSKPDVALSIGIAVVLEQKRKRSRFLGRRNATCTYDFWPVGVTVGETSTTFRRNPSRSPPTITISVMLVMVLPFAHLAYNLAERCSQKESLKDGYSCY